MLAFQQLRDVRVAALGDRKTAVELGGYVGIGVSTSNLAGRTLADLALGRQTDLTALPWVNRPLRKWEPEPIRWLGVQGMYALYALADRHEQGRSTPSPLARLGSWLTGR